MNAEAFPELLLSLFKVDKKRFFCIIRAGSVSDGDGLERLKPSLTLPALIISENCYFHTLKELASLLSKACVVPSPRNSEYM